MQEMLNAAYEDTSDAEACWMIDEIVKPCKFIELVETDNHFTCILSRDRSPLRIVYSALVKP